MLDLELSRDMDRITQLQDGILDLLTQTSTLITALTTNAHRVQTHPDLPVEVDGVTVRREETVADPATGADGAAQAESAGPVELPPAEYEALKRDLLAAFMAKAGQVSQLIDSFPDEVLPANEAEQAAQKAQRDDRLRKLESEMREANAEYKEAVRTVDALLNEVRDALDHVLADHLPGYQPELRAGAGARIQESSDDVRRTGISALSEDVVMG